MSPKYPKTCICDSIAPPFWVYQSCDYKYIMLARLFNHNEGFLAVKVTNLHFKILMGHPMGFFIVPRDNWRRYWTGQHSKIWHNMSPDKKITFFAIHVCYIAVASTIAGKWDPTISIHTLEYILWDILLIYYPPSFIRVRSAIFPVSSHTLYEIMCKILRLLYR